MATCSSILGWKIPWTEETGWLQSMGSQSTYNTTEHGTVYLNVCGKSIYRRKEYVFYCYEQHVS